MTAIVWFRNDLRLLDNPALLNACREHDCIIPIYINDPNTPLLLGAAQKWWLHYSLTALHQALQSHGLSLHLKFGDALAIINALIKSHNVTHLYWNNVYEPKHLQRDGIIKAALEKEKIEVSTFNASLLIEPAAFKNQKGDYYKVFTSFWKAGLNLIKVPEAQTINQWPESVSFKADALNDWKLLPQNPDWASRFAKCWQPGERGALDKLENFTDHLLNHYLENRDLPAVHGTSRLSPHLHFGEISPQQIWRAIHSMGHGSNEASTRHFLSELGWREFSYYLLYHFPKLPDDNFQSKFDEFPWETDDEAFNRWQAGKTGYPIVDAGMRELWQTGYMHNRVRMIVASFLTKDLLIDWRQGAAWFADTLLDADLANNSAGWQWVAGSGADAAPYFRIFNPILQGEKFDPEGDYVKRWIPELKDIPKKWIHKPWEVSTYLKPIVDHREAREIALSRFKHLE